MIKRFISYLTSLKSQNITIPLGRWTRNQNVPLKIDWANIDHCGTCSYNKLDNLIINKEKIINGIKLENIK